MRLQQGEAAASRLATASSAPRETDVLSWLAKGKANRGITAILGMSFRSANKHLDACVREARRRNPRGSHCTGEPGVGWSGRAGRIKQSRVCRLERVNSGLNLRLSAHEMNL